MSLRKGTIELDNFLAQGTSMGDNSLTSISKGPCTLQSVHSRDSPVIALARSYARWSLSFSNDRAVVPLPACSPTVRHQGQVVGRNH